MLRLRGKKSILQYNNIFWDRSRVGIRKQYVPQKKERFLCQRNLAELQTLVLKHSGHLERLKTFYTQRTTSRKSHYNF